MAFTFLLQDLFTTADDDPITSPRECEPTGDLAFVQADGGQSIADAEHKFTAQSTPAWGDQGFYDNNGQTRDSGIALFDTLNLTTWEECGIGWHTAAAVVDPDSMEHAIQATSTDGALETESGVPIATGLSTSTDYELVQVLRSVGCHYVLDGDLLWVEENAQDTAAVRPSFANLDGAGSNDDLGVVDLPDEGISAWDEDFSTVTDSQSAPANNAEYNHEADAHVSTTFTYEATNYVNTWFRGLYPDGFYHRASTNTYSYLYRYISGDRVTLGSDGPIFSDGVEHQVDLVFNGSSIKGFVDGVLLHDYTDATHTDHVLGKSEHTLDTNDIGLWAYPTPALGVATNRIICPQASETTTHAADCVFYARGVTLPSAGSLQYELRKDGGDEITLDIDSNGQPIVNENATARITGSNSDVTDGDDVCVRLNGDTVDLFVNGVQIASAYESLTLTTGTGFNMVSIGTAGWTKSVDFFPQDVSDLLTDAGVTVLPNVGTLTVEGHDPTVGFTQAIAPNLGTLTVAGHNPTVTLTQAIATANLGTMTIEGHNPTVTFTQAVTPNVGTIVIRGFKTVITAVGGAVAGGITSAAMKMVTILRHRR